MKKILSQFLSAYEQKRDIQPIEKKKILWDNKPIKEKSVLLWDLENIPFHRLDDIKRTIKYTPDELYIITKQHLGIKLLTKIQKEGFQVLKDHKTISDDKIISMMKLFHHRENMVLISSDSDFAIEVNKYLKNNKLHWIVVENVKKAVVMRVNLASTNLTLSTIEHKRAQNSHVPKNPRGFYKIKNEYDAKVYYKYSMGRIKEWLIKIKNSLVLISLQQKVDNKNLTISNIETIQKEGTRAVYRRNYKGRRVICGKLFFYDSRMKLILHKKLLHKYHMPNFKHSIEFKDFVQVENLIHFKQNENEYYLNEFKRCQF